MKKIKNLCLRFYIQFIHLMMFDRFAPSKEVTNLIEEINKINTKTNERN